jgi:hypothetical protein
MKRLSMSLFSVALAAGVWLAMGQSDEPKEPNKASKLLMQEKLAHAQKVLEGVTMKKFDLIENHAEKLISLSNMAEWKKLQTPEYSLHSDEFRRTASNMVKMAKDKNLDGAALAYVQMTMSCVECHKYVREVRMAFLDR